MKSVCMFCMLSNCKKKMCRAKGEVMRSYLNAGLQMFQVMIGCESGLIRLEDEAEMLLIRRRREERALIKSKKLKRSA